MLSWLICDDRITKIRDQRITCHGTFASFQDNNDCEVGFQAHNTSLTAGGKPYPPMECLCIKHIKCICAAQYVPHYSVSWRWANIWIVRRTQRNVVFWSIQNADNPLLDRLWQPLSKYAYSDARPGVDARTPSVRISHGLERCERSGSRRRRPDPERSHRSNPCEMRARCSRACHGSLP